MAQTYYGTLTAVGEAKDANAKALGLKLLYTDMAVGDGGGVLPVPDRLRTSLVREVRRAPLNSLKRDKINTNQVIAEQVLPENVGGWWIRELGLYDADGDLVAIANCPETYKPQLAEGSGRTQVVRMVIIVTNADKVELKIDPAIILATKEEAQRIAADAIAAHEKQDDPHSQYAKKTDSYTKREVDTRIKDYAPLKSPEFLESVKGPTPLVEDNSKNLVTTEWVRNFQKAQDFFDLPSRFDVMTAISGGAANTLYSPNITRPKGVYLVVPYVLGWGFSNAGGSYYMTALADFVSGSGSSGFANFEQTVTQQYQRSPFVIRIASANATFRLSLINNGSSPSGQGTVSINPSVNGLAFYITRIG